MYTTTNRWLDDDYDEQPAPKKRTSRSHQRSRFVHAMRRPALWRLVFAKSMDALGLLVKRMSYTSATSLAVLVALLGLGLGALGLNDFGVFNNNPSGPTMAYPQSQPSQDLGPAAEMLEPYMLPETKESPQAKANKRAKKVTQTAQGAAKTTKVAAANPTTPAAQPTPSASSPTPGREEGSETEEEEGNTCDPDTEECEEEETDPTPTPTTSSSPSPTPSTSTSPSPESTTASPSPSASTSASATAAAT